MPSYNCTHPTCSVILKAKGYCPAHQPAAVAKQSDYDKYQRDPWSKRFYNSARWRSTRAVHLSQFPMCQQCGRALAEHVHHKKPVREIRFTAPRLLYAAENLQSVCQPCHNTIEKSAGAGSC